MAKPIPDLSLPEWNPGLLELLERASLAVGGLNARVSVSPVRRAWAERASWTGFSEARRAQGAELDEIDIFALACGVSTPERRRIAFEEEEAQALRRWQSHLNAPANLHWREVVPVTGELPEGWRKRSVLLRALELVGQFARKDMTDAPWLCSPILLKTLGLVGSPLPCLVIADPALRSMPHDAATIVQRCLKRTARQAEAGLARLSAMEADRIRSASAIAKSKRAAGLRRLMALFQRRPIQSPQGIARALRLTISGAGKLVARAADVGLAVEISGRQAWKLYLTPDLAVAFGMSRKP